MPWIVSLLSAPLQAAEDPHRDLPGEVMPDRHWDFVALHLDVRVDPSDRSIAGTATHTVDPLPRTSAWLRLHQVALDIRAVRVDGAPTSGWRVGAETLDIPMPPGAERRTVEVDYAGRPETGLHFRDPRRSADEALEVWSQGESEDNRYWYPGWDYPNDRFSVSTDLTVPTGLLGIANGALLGRVDAEPGWTRWSYRLEASIPNYLVWIGAGGWDVFRDEGPVPLEYVVPRGVDEATARRTLGTTGAQMAWFADLLGARFPYPVYRQVVAQRFPFTGMENASTSVLAAYVLRIDDDAASEATERTVAHELVHQWFGDQIPCYGWSELWLNEGFAAFYAERWLEHTLGPEHAAVVARGWRAGALDDAPLAPRSWSNQAGTRSLTGLYDGGAAVLHMLRTYLGDEVFDAGIRRYVARADGFVETSDLRRALEDASGTHLGWLFDTWVHDGGTPTASTEHAWSDGELTVTLRQQAEAPFALPVDVEVGTTAGTTRHRIWLDTPEARLVLPLAEPAAWVAVDPDAGTLVTWRHAQGPDEWVAQLRRSPSAAARLEAMAQLAEGAGLAPAVVALTDVALTDGHDGRYRAQAIDALAALGGPAGQATLVEALGEADPLVRAAAARALGTAGAEARRGLEELLRDDPVAVVAAAALEALAALDSERALPHARAVLRGPDLEPRRWEHVAAIGVLAAHGRSADLDLLLRHVDAREARPVRHAAARASVSAFARLDPTSQAARRAALSRALEPMLDDADLLSRQLGAQLLGEVGDRRSEERLRAQAGATTIAAHREAALDAAERIHAREHPPSDPPP
jgi:aminopeptidase N